MAAILTCLGAGAAGLPVFAGSPERGIGLAYMMGPTGGFLIGMVIRDGRHRAVGLNRLRARR